MPGQSGGIPLVLKCGFGVELRQPVEFLSGNPSPRFVGIGELGLSMANQIDSGIPVFGSRHRIPEMVGGAEFPPFLHFLFRRFLFALPASAGCIGGLD